ncbi:hypothetical protein HPB47_016939, partial [Ixodes persulcatus]
PEGKLNLSQYKLPELPKDIAFAMKQHDWSKPIPWKLRQRVLEWLFHDLCRYSMYPGKLYAEAARQLVWYHKNLADNSFGTGYPLDVEDTFEDEHSLCGHREWLRREMKKPIPDMEKVRDVMERTFKSRRKYVCNDGPSVSALMEMYPALCDKDQVTWKPWCDNIVNQDIRPSVAVKNLAIALWGSSVLLQRTVTEVALNASLNKDSRLPLTPKKVTFLRGECKLSHAVLAKDRQSNSAPGQNKAPTRPIFCQARLVDLQCLALFLILACLLEETDASFLTEEVGNAVYPVAVSTSALDPGADNYVAVEDKRFAATSTSHGGELGRRRTLAQGSTGHGRWRGECGHYVEWRTRQTNRTANLDDDVPMTLWGRPLLGLGAAAVAADSPPGLADDRSPIPKLPRQ